jgi:hypothetical protein
MRRLCDIATMSSSRRDGDDVSGVDWLESSMRCALSLMSVETRQW